MDDRFQWLHGFGRRRALIGSLVVVLLFLGAALSALASAPEASASSPPPVVDAGANWRELRIGAGIDMTVGTVNPLTATLVSEFYLWVNVYSSLVNAGPDFEYEPDIAVRWTQISANPSKWDIWLARNAFFADPRLCTADAAGHLVSCPDAAKTQVTANDVKFTYDFVFEHGSETAYMEPCIDRLKSDPVTGAPTGVVVLAPDHLTIEFDGPYAPAEYTFFCIPILPQYYWTGRAANWPAEPPIGSGPYMARPLGPGEGRVPIRLDRNPFWHGTEVMGRQQLVDTIIFSSETSTAAHVQKLLSTEIDLTLAASPFEWKIFLAGKPGIKRQLVYGTFVAQMNVNVLEDDIRAMTIAPKKNGHTHPMMLFWEVRSALHIAADRQRMIDEGQLGLGVPADTLVPIDHPWHYDVGPAFSWTDSDGDGNPFDYTFDPAQYPPGLPVQPGVPYLREEFPEGKTDSDGDKIPDSVEVAKRLLHDGGWLYDCDTGAVDTPAEPALPLCKKTAAGSIDTSTRLQFLMSTFNNPPSWKSDVDSFIRNAAEIGIQVDLELLNISGMNNLWYGTDYEIWHWGWVLAANLDVSSGIMSIGLCDQILNGLSNDFGYCPRDANGRWIYDDLYNQSLTETNSAARRAITDNLQKMIYDHAAYNLPFYGGNTYAYHELRWTNFRDWNQLNALPPDIGNPSLIGQMLEPVDNRPPQFALSPLTGFVGAPIQFAVSAIDPEGLPLSYRWDFDATSEPGGAGVNGDGIYNNDAQSTLQNPTFTYGSEGLRTVSLRVSESGGEWFTVQRTAVNVIPPQTQVTPTVSAVGFSPLDPADTDTAVTLAATAADPRGRPLTYQWDFTNDGTFDATGVTASFDYPVGTHTVRVRATNDLGQFGEFFRVVQVVANVAATIAPIENSQAVVNEADTYVAFASDPNARDDLSYEWDFAGTIVQGNPVSFAFPTQGLKSVTLRVRDTPPGATVPLHTASWTFQVDVIPPGNHGPDAVGDMLRDPAGIVYTTQDVRLTVTVKDPEGNPLRWDWDFDGGGVDLRYETGVTSPGELVTRTETFRFTTAGSVTPSVTVWDIPPAGTPHFVTVPLTFTVTGNTAPVVTAIVASPGTAVNPGQTVTFSVEETADSDVCDYFWDFGDGTSVTGTTIPGCTGGGLSPRSHAYATGGQYIVSVTVDDRKGGRDSSGVVIDVIDPETILVDARGQWPELAEGQTMDVTFTASVAAGPLFGAVVSAVVSSGGSLSAPSCTTDLLGQCKLILTAGFGSLGSTLTVTGTANKAPYTASSDAVGTSVVTARTMSIPSVTSNRVEMMSFETATIRVRLESAGVGVPTALITPSTRFGGTFTAVSDLGGGTYEFGWTAPVRTTQGFARIDVRAKVGGYTDATSFTTILVDPNRTNPANPTQLFLLTSAPTSVQDGNSATVTIFLFTIEGFVVSGGTVTARLFGPGSITLVRDDLNGVYRLTYNAPASVAGPTNIRIDITANKFGYAVGTTRVGITVLP